MAKLAAAVLEPAALWTRVALELEQRPQRLARQLVLISLGGPLGCALAVYVGTQWLTTLWHNDFGFLPTVAQSGRIDPFRATLLGAWLAPLLLALAFLVLAPMYRQPRRVLASFAVALVGALPVYAAGLLMFTLPAILLVLLAFCVSCFWWSQGAQRLLGIRQDDAGEFLVLALVGSSVVLQFCGALAARLVT